MANAQLIRTTQRTCGAATRLAARCPTPGPCPYTRLQPHPRQCCDVLRPRKSPRRTVVRSSPDEVYDNLFNSPVFRSELVMKEFTNLVKEVTGLSGMAAKFPDFDLAGKRMYLDRMQEVSERYEVFIKRLELSQDPAAREYLRSTNAQMLEGGFTLNQMFVGLKQSLDDYRRWVEQEERVSSDPVAHQQFLKHFREMWATGVLGRVDLSYLLQSTDPGVILRAQRDPKFWLAIKEITGSPTPEVMARWLDDPNIGPLVAELWKSM
ncbi:hypothetical protein Agub_g6188, partial [Astrephomene gubernaculifera]